TTCAKDGDRIRTFIFEQKGTAIMPNPPFSASSASTAIRQAGGLKRHMLALILLAPLAMPPVALAQDSVASVVAARSLERQEGFIPFYWDEAEGRVLMEISVFNEDVLYYVSTATGGGSVELPLDRGLMASKVIHFQRSGS